MLFFCSNSFSPRQNCLLYDRYLNAVKDKLLALGQNNNCFICLTCIFNMLDEDTVNDLRKFETLACRLVRHTVCQFIFSPAGFFFTSPYKSFSYDLVWYFSDIYTHHFWFPKRNILGENKVQMKYLGNRLGLCQDSTI